MAGIAGRVPGAGSCVVPGCEKNSQRGQLMCRACWFRVTPSTRGAVNRAWRDYQRGQASLLVLRAAQEQAVREAEA